MTKTLMQILNEAPCSASYDKPMSVHEWIIMLVREWLMQKRQEYPLEEQKFGDYFRNKAKLSLIDELLEELAQEGTQASK